MNYYERHLGDYARDTAHLSILEHGVYTLLLDRYYATEHPIPADQAHRVARARSREEKAAVDAVLSEFFHLEVDGWHNKRADIVIAEYQDAEPDREAKRDNVAERQRRHRKRRKELFDSLREHGVVPKYDTPTADLELSLSRVTGALHHEAVTRDATATHTPDTSNQSKSKSGTTHTTDIPKNSGVGVETPAGHAAAALNRAGCRVTSQNPNLIAACTEGVTTDLLLEVYGQYPDKPAGYVIAAARRIHAEKANPVRTGTPHEIHRIRDRISLADQVVMPDDERRSGVIEGTAVAVARR